MCTFRISSRSWFCLNSKIRGPVFVTFFILVILCIISEPKLCTSERNMLAKAFGVTTSHCSLPAENSAFYSTYSQNHDIQAFTMRPNLRLGMRY